MLHFSDGDLEEYSSEDEVDKMQGTKVIAEVDPVIKYVLIYNITLLIFSS